MPSNAICYVTDDGFLFPSIVSIKSLAAKTNPDHVKVYLFVIDVAESVVEGVKAYLAGVNVEVVSLSSSLLGGFNMADFNETHVTVATLGRFFIEPMLADDIKQIIYIDGDTLIRSDLSALIDVTVPAGRFLAAEDLSSFCRADSTPFGGAIKDYFAGIDVPPSRGYFNAGVFKVERQTWKDIGAEAFKFFLNNTKLCRYHDQSALNAVVQDRRLVMSVRYNFQTPYLYWGVERATAPALYHFTQTPKPWVGRSPPWGRFFDHYQEFEADRLALGLPKKSQTSGEAKTYLKAHIYQVASLHGPLLPRLLRRRKAFRALEESAFLR